jgi:hypothetical protein
VPGLWTTLRVHEQRLHEARTLLDTACNDLDDRVNDIGRAGSLARQTHVQLHSRRSWRAKSMLRDALILAGRADYELGEVEAGLMAILAALEHSVRGTEVPDKHDAGWAELSLAEGFGQLGADDLSAGLAADAFSRMPSALMDRQFVVRTAEVLLAAKRRELAASAIEHLTLLSDSSVAEEHAIHSLLLHCTRVTPARPHELISHVLAASKDPRLITTCALRVARELREAGDLDAAKKLLEHHRSALVGSAASWWTVARVGQDIALLHLMLGNNEEALAEATQAWLLHDAGRSAVGSAYLRRVIERRYSRTRSVALQAACRMKAWGVVMELIETARLQVVPELLGDHSAFDSVRRTGEAPSNRSGSLRGHHVLRVERLPEWPLAAYNRLMEGRLETHGRYFVGPLERSLLSHLLPSQSYVPQLRHFITTTSEHLLRPDTLAPGFDCAWGTWTERRYLFWWLFDGKEILGGELDLTRHSETESSLARLRAAFASEEGDESPTFDEADSFEELELTRPLVDLIADPLLQRIRGAPPGAPLRVTVHLAPDLRVIPWPILPVDESHGLATRLIEKAVFQYVPSLATQMRMEPTGPLQSGGDRGFPLGCRLLGRQASYTARPEAAFGLEGLQGTRMEAPATLENVMFAMRDLEPGANGLAFFACHFAPREDDPASSGLELSNANLQAAFLFGRDQVDKRPLVGLPSHVVLSCCSSAGLTRTGGATFGFVSACMHAGARHLIATAVDISDVPFTDAFDDMLMSMMLSTADHAGDLRHLQLRMLDEWRTFTLRGWRHGNNGLGGPTPTVWAYYQAYGMET